MSGPWQFLGPAQSAYAVKINPGTPLKARTVHPATFGTMLRTLRTFKKLKLHEELLRGL